MRLSKITGGGAVLEIDFENLTLESVAPMLEEMAHRPSVIGIVSELPVHASILACFEAWDTDANGITLAWASNGYAYVDEFRQFHIATWPNDYDEPQDFEIPVGMDVFIGYAPGANTDEFVAALREYQRQESNH